MRIIADLHIHSKFSRATSSNMEIPEIAHYARLKGLNLVGTGDFTHPNWMRILEEGLTSDETGIHKPKNDPQSPIRFILGTEVSTIFEFENTTRKVHHVILTPSFGVAKQIIERLSHYGDLATDGRPTLKMSAAELVEVVTQISSENEVLPAHAWTPWFSMFGAFNGFDRLADCYQDMSSKIHALETGLSSDPPMNWRISNLDRLVLVSNSDSHSPWPWRIGREANIFELNKMDYGEILEAFREKDKNKLICTIETGPEYGKYHWTGHRNCKFSVPPPEAIALNNICPICHRKLTKGVDQRVEELADRPKGYRPRSSADYVHLLPLHEIIAATLKMEVLSSPKIWDIYNTAISHFSDEYNVLLNASEKELNTAIDPLIVKAIMRVRNGQFKIEPGYDGVYGKIILEEDEVPEKRTQNTSVRKEEQMKLDDYSEGT